MYDSAIADRAVNFIRLLRHTKGEWAGVPFLLQDWQENGIIRPLFGNVDSFGLRLFRTAYIEIPRKNGKTELIAGLGLFLLMADNEPGAEIYSAASDREQASIIFNAAAAMVRKNPALSKRCKIIDSQKRILYLPTNSFYCAVSADAFSKHGYNAHAVLYDELHAARTRELWDVLVSSMGARRQPLTLAITTAGSDRTTICWEQHDYAERVLAGTVVDPSFFAYIRAAGKDDDWKDEQVWAKANPNLGVSVKLNFLRSEALRAKNIPAFQNTFKRLYLNIWTQQVTRWLDLDVWAASSGLPAKIEDYKGREAYVALDLSSALDLTAGAISFPEPDGTIQLFTHYWMPEENLRFRIDRDRVPYDAWIRDGFVTATPGSTIRKDFVKATLDKWCEDFYVQQIAYDPWSATELVKELMDEGYEMVQFRQGFASMSPACKEFLKVSVEKRLKHGNNPVLNWMAGNIAVKEDPAGNIKPDKVSSHSRIDGIVASIMSVDGALRSLGGASIYETGGVKTIG